MRSRSAYSFWPSKLTESSGRCKATISLKIRLWQPKKVECIRDSSLAQSGEETSLWVEVAVGGSVVEWIDDLGIISAGNSVGSPKQGVVSAIEPLDIDMSEGS